MSDAVNQPAPGAEGDAYIPVEEASQLLGLKRRQVNNLGRNGKLQTRREGRRVLYRRADVHRIALARAHAAAAEASMPPGIGLLGDHQVRAADLEAQLLDAQRRIGRLEGELHLERQQVQELQTLRAREQAHLAPMQRDIAALKAAVEQLTEQLAGVLDQPGLIRRLLKGGR